MMSEFGSMRRMVSTQSKAATICWRVCHEMLPVYATLYRKKITVLPICPLCSQAEESTLHALRDCVLAKDVWQRSIVSSCWSQDETSSTISWISRTSATMDDKSFQLGLIIMWSIWNSRNASVKNEDRTGQGTWEFAAKYYQEISNPVYIRFV